MKLYAVCIYVLDFMKINPVNIIELTFSITWNNHVYHVHINKTNQYY